MKAIVQDRYGGLETLEFRDVDKPAPKDNEVLVRVHAAGLDRGVWHVMAGLPYMLRIIGFGLRRPKVRVRGMDVAGQVEAVGRNVTRFQPGDAVFGWTDGSYAEYACAPEDHFAPKPANLTFEQAAVVPDSNSATTSSSKCSATLPAATARRATAHSASNRSHWKPSNWADGVRPTSPPTLSPSRLGHQRYDPPQRR